MDSPTQAGSGWKSERDAALRFLEQRNYPSAMAAFEQPILFDQTGESHALMGLACYQSENYEQAAHYYEAALKLSADHDDWRDMLAKSSANAIAGVNVPVPDIYYFDRQKLLEPAGQAAAPLPTSSLKPRREIWTEKLCRRIGSVFGELITFAMNGSTIMCGWVIGYRDRIWTNWYRRPMTLGILTLAYMREQLNKKNLKNTYPPGTLTGFQNPDQKPPEGAIYFRTADGSWNNLADPKEGAAGTRFLRNVSVEAIRPETGERLMTPNPREISRKLLARPQKGEATEMREIPFLNLLAAAWIQFQNGDWINHGEMVYREVHEIPLAGDDPARLKYRQTKMFIGKTQPDPTWTPGQEQTPITFINEVTHWWDGSQIYGSDQETQNRLRTFVDGKLRLNPDGTLPTDSKSVEETGFRRNWWVGVAILHTLFVHEHNAICDHLKIPYPHWGDNRLFNVARLINAAVMAKIHSVEWTPAILPNPGLNVALNANWFGILTNLFRSGKNRKTLAEINIRNPEMGGVVGNPIDKHGQPFGFTEEFTEVYRLHSLLPESLQLKKIGNNAAEEISFPVSRQAGSAKLTGKFGVANILYSFGTQHPGALELNNYPRFMQELSIPGNPLFDMGAVDILRARERGVPRYNEFRRQLGMNPICSFDDLTPNKEHVEKLKQVYGDKSEDVEKLDLLIGTLSEGYRPTGFGFGETMFQIFILNATRRLQADRFYTDNYNEETYTKEGLDWIDNSTFRYVLLRNYPELAHTGLANVTNAFEPWDTQQRLDPERHPLRAFDEELQPDPSLGDAYR